MIDGRNPASLPQAPELIARIPVGTAQATDQPRGIALTSDGTRTYAALEGSGQVAVIDPMMLQPIDADPQTPNVIDSIQLMNGAVL